MYCIVLGVYVNSTYYYYDCCSKDKNYIISSLHRYGR